MNYTQIHYKFDNIGGFTVIYPFAENTSTYSKIEETNLNKLREVATETLKNGNSIKVDLTELLQREKEEKIFKDWERKKPFDGKGDSTRHKANTPMNRLVEDAIERQSNKDLQSINSDLKSGVKETDGKVDYSEIDWVFITQLAERMNSNKDKYPPNNWKKSINIELLKQSLLRHVIAVMSGFYEDDGRICGHLESIALNAQFINYQLKNESR